MSKIIEIDGTKIGEGQPPYIIAELSGNHNGDINRAKELIKVAKDSGASAVKLQTYTADSLTIDSDKPEFIVETGQEDSPWNGKNLYSIYEWAHTPLDWFPKLFQYAKEIGITVFSSPFDVAAVELLERLDAPAYKIASNEFTDWPLVEATVNTGKPIIMSTGAATKQDVQDTIEFVRELGGEDRLVVLHCVSAYPALAKDTHLNTMIDIGDNFDVLYGLSDHTLGTETSVTAVTMGACMIEKHITMDRTDGGPDSHFSLEPDELTTLCYSTKYAYDHMDKGLTKVIGDLKQDITWAKDSIGSVVYGGDTKLKEKGIFTRQFYSLRKIEKGELLTDDNIRSIRAPSDAGGVSPKLYREVKGSVVVQEIPEHSPILLESIE